MSAVRHHPSQLPWIFQRRIPMHSNVDLFQESLTALDLSRLAITARFVVFSSCLSAYSPRFRFRHSLSFAHALLGSGACAFVGTLWVTGDVASLVFMVLFYKAMMDRGLTPSGALAERAISHAELHRDGQEPSSDDLLCLFNQEAEKTGGLSTIQQYVINYRYWIDRQLRRYDVSDLRRPWSWAGFVLIGYGESRAYSPPSC